MWKYSLLLLCSIHCLNAVRIVGLFPDHTNQPADFWVAQAVAMFRAAFTLASKYNISVGGEPIKGVVQQYEPNPNNLSDMSLIYRLIMDRNESDILGVVGPLTSESARFLSPLASHMKLPFNSYAATSFGLSDINKHPFFYRTAPSDAYLAEAIVRLFEKFKWHTCTMIIEKDDYGHDGVRLLLEKYHRNISVVERILFDTRNNKFHGNLSKVLDRNPSRIVLIWASGGGSTSIIRHAIEQSLIPGDHVWLTTNKVGFETFLVLLSD
jgi:hypothetical protein